MPTMMRDRPAGIAAVEQLLRVRAQDRPRTRIDHFFGLAPLSEESRPWFTGAVGEIAVGRMLESLPPSWVVYHALPIGNRGSDIDHLVVGPGGVFTINTKTHRRAKIWVGDRAILVNGHKQPYLRNSVHEGERISKVLRPLGADYVRPVLAFYDPAEITWKQRPADVSVLEARGLVRWLVKQPHRLEGAAVARIAGYVDDPRHWAVTVDGGDSMTAFAEVRAEVDKANMRRNGWASLLAMGAGAIVVVPWLANVLGR